MTTTAVTDSNTPGIQDAPGAQLALIRETRGFTKEFVAVKLHLRVRIIELLEADDYPNLPEPVFIKGYLRAYAKLLGVSPDPYLQVFNTQYCMEKHPEKALWQSRRESHIGERLVRWVTGLVAISAIVVVGFWWQKNRDEQPVPSVRSEQVREAQAPARTKNEPANVSALSRMQSMFTSLTQDVPAESKRG